MAHKFSFVIEGHTSIFLFISTYEYPLFLNYYYFAWLIINAYLEILDNKYSIEAVKIQLEILECR